MTLEEMKEIGFYPTSFKFEGFDHITIELRSEDKWAVKMIGSVLNTDGEFEYEPMPSSRDEEFLSRTRFILDEAIRRALDAINTDPYIIREIEINNFRKKIKEDRE